jgi:hypothetical protein
MVPHGCLEEHDTAARHPPAASSCVLLGRCQHRSYIVGLIRRVVVVVGRMWRKQLEERICEHLKGTGQEAALRGLGAGSGANWLGGFARVLDRGVNMLIGDAPPVESSQPGGRSSSGACAPRPPRPPGGYNQNEQLMQQQQQQQQQTAVSTAGLRIEYAPNP